MNEQIHIERGFSPWRPASDAQMVKQYAYFEIPLTGVIEQGDHRFLFHCAGGADEPTSFWFYLPLPADLERRLDEASPHDFDSLVEVNDGVVMAMALNGPIVAFTVVADIGRLADEGLRLISNVQADLTASEDVARSLPLA